MNGIEKITSRIATDNEQEINTLLTRARHEAVAITDSFRGIAKSESDEAVAKAVMNAEEREQRLAGVALLDANKLILATKQEVLDRAFSQALDRLIALPEDQIVDFLAKLAADASNIGREEVILSTDDHARFGQSVVSAANELLNQSGKTAQLTLSGQTRQMKGGLYLKDGNIENNCTFETIIRILRENMSGEVAKVLFED